MKSLRLWCAVGKVAFMGYLGPLFLLALAIGMSGFQSAASVVLVIFLGVVGFFIVNWLKLDVLTNSLLGRAAIGASMSLAILALSSMLVRDLFGFRHFWVVMLSLIVLVAFRPQTRQGVVQMLEASEIEMDASVTALWVLICAVLAASHPVFLFGSLTMLILHLTFRNLRRAVRGAQFNTYAPVWLALGGLLLFTNLIGWRQQGPWSFAMMSTDTHIWVSRAWSVSEFGSTADPLIAGINASYHSGAMAMAGLFSVLSSVPSIAAVSLVVPIIAIAPAFFVLRDLFTRAGSSRWTVWAPLVVLLASFNVLEPNNALSTESFTHLVSIPYVVIAIGVLRRRLEVSSPQHRLSLILISLIATEAKVFSAPSIMIVLTVTIAMCFVIREFAAARRISVDLILVGLVLLIQVWPEVQGNAGGDLFWTEFGLQSLLYRFIDVVGGPEDIVLRGGNEAVLLLFILLTCLTFLAVTRILVSRGIISGRNSPVEILGTSVSLSALILMLGSFCVGFPPNGYAHRYLSSTGLVYVALGGLLTVITIRGYPRRQFLAAKSGTSLILSAIMFAGFLPAALLWSNRTRNWPSVLSFSSWYLMPYLVCVLVALIVCIRVFRNKDSNDDLRSRTSLQFFSILLPLLLVVAVGATAGYAMRWPLGTLIEIREGRTSLAEFRETLMQGQDKSAKYKEIILAVSANTSPDAVLATNVPMPGQLFLAAESKRRLWWSAYTGDMERPSVGLNEHLAWRKRLVGAFASVPEPEIVSAMRDCGVAYYVLDLRTITRNLASYSIDDYSKVIWSSRDYAIVRFEAGSQRQSSKNNAPVWCPTVSL